MHARPRLRGKKRWKNLFDNLYKEMADVVSQSQVNRLVLTFSKCKLTAKNEEQDLGKDETRVNHQALLNTNKKRRYPAQREVVARHKRRVVSLKTEKTPKLEQSHRWIKTTNMTDGIRLQLNAFSRND